MMGWLLFIAFILTWFLCFTFCYKLLYLDWIKTVKCCKDSDRYHMIFISSLHLVGVIVTVVIIIISGNCIQEYSDKREKLGKGNFIIKMVKKLEK